MIAVKKNFILMLMMVISSSTVFAEAKQACPKKVICADTVKAKTICADELIVKTGCCASYTITAKDFMDAEGNLSQTFVISEPGKYSLGENINFAPLDSVPAIQILSSDVYLNLCDNTLRQVDKSVTDVYGVQIGEGYNYNDPDNVLKNITITNGSIIDFSAIGVFCYNGSFDGGAGELAFESLTFTDLNILDCGSHGSTDYASGVDLDSAADFFVFNPATQVAYKNVIIENCRVNRCLGVAALNIFTGDNIIIKNTQANECTNEVNIIGVVAAYAINARNLQMFDCQGNGTTDLDPTAINGTCVGGLINYGNNVYIKDCQFNDTFGEADFLVIGGEFDSSINGIYENCQFNNSRGGENAGGVDGVHMSDSTFQETEGNGLKFINCQFNGGRISPTNPGTNSVSRIRGVFLITVRNVIFENCQACNIITENPFFDVTGFRVGTNAEDPLAEFASSRNITFSNCIASDLSGLKSAVGFCLFSGANNRGGEQSAISNINVINCIAERIYSSTDTERVAGIGFINVLPPVIGQFPKSFNFNVKNCRVSDVHSLESPLSAGILAESVIRPNITGNSVSDCDRGVLFTGITDVIPNGFQVAQSAEDALAFPPVFINLDVSLKLFTSPAIAGSPFDAFYTINGPRLTAPISAQGEIADPSNACDTVTNNLTDKIGIVIRDGSCNSGTFVLNTEAAGNPIAATLIIDNTGDPSNFGGSPAQTQVAVAISQDDGDVLLAALEVNPTLTLIIDTIPSVSNPEQTFFNLARGNSVDINAGQVDTDHDFIITETTQFDFTTAGWQAGDPIFYDCNGGTAIPDLVCSTTYYAIVYIPGYSENGVVMNNQVDNCTVSGYEDAKPTTSSAWVNNFAFNSGTPASSDANYDIVWSGTAPVYAGDLANYPTGSAKAYNISLIQ